MKPLDSDNKPDNTDVEETPDSNGVDAATGEGDIFSREEREYVEDPNLPIKKDKADEYFKKGTLLYEGGDYASAAQAFLVAYETLPHQAVLGNVALCFDKAGKIPEATVYYRRYLEKPVGSEKNEFMSSRLKELEALIGTVDVTCPDPNCEIRVNGITRGKGHVGVVVMPGEQRVEGFLDDTLFDSQVIEVDNREKRSVTLVKEEAPQKKPVLIKPLIKPLPTVDVDKPELGAGFWVAMSSTVVSGVAIAVFGSLALHTRAEQHDTDDPTKTNNLYNEGTRYKLVTNIMIGVTGISALTALIIGINDLKGKKRSVSLSNGGADLGLGVAVSF